MSLSNGKGRFFGPANFNPPLLLPDLEKSTNSECICSYLYFFHLQKLLIKHPRLTRLLRTTATSLIFDGIKGSISKRLSSNESVTYLNLGLKIVR